MEEDHLPVILDGTFSKLIKKWMEKRQRLFITGSLIEMTIKQMSVGKSQILSSRRLLANLKYYQADDVASHKRL